jgi:hypothetical protein
VTPDVRATLEDGGVTRLADQNPSSNPSSGRAGSDARGRATTRPQRRWCERWHRLRGLLGSSRLVVGSPRPPQRQTDALSEVPTSRHVPKLAKLGERQAGRVLGSANVNDLGDPLALPDAGHLPSLAAPLRAAEEALEIALELIDLGRNGTTLGIEFPESRARIDAALAGVQAPAPTVAKHLYDALLAIYVEELNGRICRMPDGLEPDTDLGAAVREARTCASCRAHWERARAAIDAYEARVQAPAGEPECICPRFRDLPEGTIIADLTCPVHGVDGTDPGDVLPAEYEQAPAGEDTP